MIKITTDSTADLNSYFKKYDVDYLPLIVNLGENSFYDIDTVSPSDIYNFVASTGKLPKTAARSIDEFKEFFSKYTSNGDEVIHFNISSKISVTHENALKAASLLKGVYVIDSKSLSSGTGLLVLRACDLVKQGKSAEDIYNECTALAPHVQASFVVDSLKYLHKGGRCSGLASLASSVLKIKPTILLKDGNMVVGKKYMGRYEKIIGGYVDNIINEYNTPDTTRAFITYTEGTPDSIINIVKSRLQEKASFKEIICTSAGSTITSHCGKCTLGILYINA